MNFFESAPRMCAADLHDKPVPQGIWTIKVPGGAGALPEVGCRLPYIWTAEGWLCAAAVMDLYSRRIVGWSMSDTMQARMVSDTLLMALCRRGKPAALMHHSDQGSQYTSDEFQQLLKSQNITCNMSRRGECWDNAAMESFFSKLKTERCARTVYQTREQARADDNPSVNSEGCARGCRRKRTGYVGH